MKSVLEPLDGNKVKLSIEVGEQEFERDIDVAFRKIAKEVRIPGFRPGKAPRRLLESRLGKEAGRTEALRDALPGYYAQALADREVDAISPPDIDIVAGKDSGPVSFDAVVEVRPQLHLAGYGGLRITVPSALATEEEVEARIDRLRRNFGTLEQVERPARQGDNLTVDIHGSRSGEEMAPLSATDFVYELGSGSVVPELDDSLQGAKVGSILEFDADVPDGKAHFRVLVKDVQELALPPVTDAWAAEASEFETVQELRDDIERQISVVKRFQASMAVRELTVDALVELVDSDPPEALVADELQRRAEELAERLERQGAGLGEYLAATGQTEEQLVEELRKQALPAVQADLALRAVAEAEDLEATDEDIEQQIERIAESYKMKPARVRRNLERANQMAAVRSDVRKGKALEWLVEHVEMVDPEGRPFDRSLLEPEEDGLLGETGSEPGDSTTDRGRSSPPSADALSHTDNESRDDQPPESEQA